jgi:AraC-like DNA-binding protein
MVPRYHLLGYGPVSFYAGLPKGWKGKILPEGQYFSFHNDAGEIVIQQYQYQDWCIRYGVFRFFKKMVMQWTEEAALRIRFVLQGNLHYKGEGKNFRINRGMVGIIWAPGRETYATFSKNEEYILFQMQYAPALVRELWPLFPDVARPDERKTFAIEKEWNQTINSVLDAPFAEDTLRFHFENKVREILLFLLVRPGSGMRYEGITTEDVQKIRQADAIILSDPAKWPSVPSLAKAVQLSQFKLKTAFKQVIGMNMSERVTEAKLEQGRGYLLQTDLQIKVIYSKVGYKSISGFEDAFKAKYGLSPLQYRKKHQPPGG